MAEAQQGIPLDRDASGRIPELDGIRGVAILLVLLWHYVAVQLDPAVGGALGVLRRALLTCWSGVDLFFVLSGFLIGGILIDHKRSPSYFSTFYIRRVCRIFPLYYLCLILFVVGMGPMDLGARFPWIFHGNGQLPLAPYFTYIQNHWMIAESRFGPFGFGVTWSLAIEEQFYVLLPFLVWVLPVRRMIALLGLLTLATPVIRYFAYEHMGLLAPYLLLPGRWDALFLGVILAWAVRQPATLAFLRAHLRGLRVLTAILAAGAALLTVLTPDFAHPLTSIFGFTWLALFYTALLALVVTGPRGWVGAVARWRGLRELGLISYGVYLIHQPVVGFCHQLLRGHTHSKPVAPNMRGLDDVLVIALATGVTLGLAWASYRYFETPLIRLGHRRKYAPAPPEGETGSGA